MLHQVAKHLHRIAPDMEPIKALTLALAKESGKATSVYGPVRIMHFDACCYVGWFTAFGYVKVKELDY